jgi:hypothetical protein
MGNFSCDSPEVKQGWDRRSGVAWPTSQRALFTRLWNDGAPGSDIMTIMGLPYLSAVYCARVRYGLPARAREPKPFGTPESLEQAALAVAAENERKFRERQAATQRLRKLAPATASATPPETPALVLPQSRAQQPLPKSRNCLRCSKLFVSSGPGNRMCPRCQTAPEWAY